MIIEITEYSYKGITLQLAKDKGWKCNLGGVEYLFPHSQAAESAINEIFRGIKPIILKNKGKALPQKDKQFACYMRVATKEQA